MTAWTKGDDARLAQIIEILISAQKAEDDGSKIAGVALATEKLVALMAAAWSRHF